MGKNIIEKILARASDRREVSPGEIVEARIDLAMLHENTGTPAVMAFREIGLDRVWDPSKIIVIFDHNAPASTEVAAGLHKYMRVFVKEFKIGTFYDIREGICHQVLPEKGLVLPGQVVVGVDSHTCTYGALGVFSTGIGSTEMAGVLATGTLWFKVPETLKFVYKGQLPEMVSPKDVILMTMGKITSEGANYKSIEFAGPTIEAMSMGGRMTLCNMAIEMGGKAGMVEPDGKTLAYLSQRTQKKLDIVKTDREAVYERIIEFDVSKLEPQVACPHSVDNVKNISEVEGKEIHQAVIGSCTNGRVEDLREAAEILRGKTIPIDVRLIVFPASREVYLDAMKEGIIETLIKAGAVVCNPNCGPCCGGHEGIMAEGEVSITTFNRNFRGRMGKGAEIYLASPRVVAASALKGRITDPRKIK
ncbi:MAG: 3-isopropylmalate dehydratase large subunit [Thermodesulfobacteriota bacterium]|nr:3-isopropylmalate dehydratase large subunit [Thermodesulfobacteriota bacterium]